MNAKELPAHPSLEQYKKQAKDLLKAWKEAIPKRFSKSRNIILTQINSRVPAS